MEQPNHSVTVDDAAGVLPMDTDEGENHRSSSPNVVQKKKGRGRPPKSTSSSKTNIKSDGPKRGRGRPPKSVEVLTKPSKSSEKPSSNDDGNKKKRGRPSKKDTLNEQVNGVSKPQVQSTPNGTRQQQNGVEPVKRKRGRPSQASLLLASKSKNTVPSKKKRGRPSGSKKFISKPKVTTNGNGPAKKRGRPKKVPVESSSASSNVESSTTTATTSPTA